MREKIEVAPMASETPVYLVAGEAVQSGAAAPLRAHGLTMGVLAVAGRGGAPFTPENLWLLSTLTTHVAVVLANSRLFEMVRQAKEEWETAFNALAEGIAVVDGAGRVRRANEALARMIGLPAPTLIGKGFWETVIGPSETATDLIAAVHRGERRAPVVLRSETLNRMLRLTGALLTEAVEEPAVVVLVEDVTDQQALETQLIQNEKLAAVGQLVSGVAHELNNPLTSIAGLSEFLLERTDLAPQDREHLRVIHEQAERAGRIVRNLLIFARKGSPETAPLDLNDVVARTTLLISYELKLRGIELQQRIHPGPVTVLGERTELQQVLLNLLTNAVHAVDNGPDGSPRRIMVETGREGGQAVVRVRDSGRGVPAALVPQLFTPFFTTKDPGEGTGLGLSISYGIVESHGGRLAYQPVPEGGSEFTVTLPLHAEAIASPAEQPAPAPSRDPGRYRERRILLVDDDPGVHRMVSALFGRDGHTVDIARNGAHALTLAEERTYDLVIADPRATAGPGQLFADTLLERQPAMQSRLLLATADASRETVEELRNNGYLVVVKPFKLRELTDAAAQVFRTEG
jgi:two-component system NtrC family sensor kinase